MRSDIFFGVRILRSVASLFVWLLSKCDIKAEFLQKVDVERDEYIMAPCDNGDRGKILWHRLTAAYGLVNANAK